MYGGRHMTGRGRSTKRRAPALGRAAAIAGVALSLIVAGCQNRNEDAKTEGSPSSGGTSGQAGALPIGPAAGEQGAAAARVAIEARPEPPLFNAVRKRDARGAEALLDGGADANATDGIGRTALHSASFHDRGPVAELLIDRGANIHAKDTDGLSPLHAAALADNRALATLLIDRGADINARTNLGLTPLHLASATGQNQMLRLLIDRGARIDAQDSDGGTPLFYATRNGHSATVTLLQAKDGKK